MAQLLQMELLILYFSNKANEVLLTKIITLAVVLEILKNLEWFFCCALFCLIFISFCSDIFWQCFADVAVQGIVS